MQERSRSHHRTEWLSTPNAYHKVEVEETGTPNPRKFTRWVPDKEGEKPNSGTATPVRSANQFAPQVSGSPLSWFDSSFSLSIIFQLFRPTYFKICEIHWIFFIHLLS